MKYAINDAHSIAFDAPGFGLDRKPKHFSIAGCVSSRQGFAELCWNNLPGTISHLRRFEFLWD